MKKIYIIFSCISLVSISTIVGAEFGDSSTERKPKSPTLTEIVTERESNNAPPTDSSTARKPNNSATARKPRQDYGQKNQREKYKKRIVIPYDFYRYHDVTEIPSNAIYVSELPENEYTSIMFVGENGIYDCNFITADDKWLYFIAKADVQACTIYWDTSEYKEVYINGMKISRNQKVYSFQNVIKKDVNLETVDIKGKRQQHILRITN